MNSKDKKVHLPFWKRMTKNVYGIFRIRRTWKIKGLVTSVDKNTVVINAGFILGTPDAPENLISFSIKETRNKGLYIKNTYMIVNGYYDEKDNMLSYKEKVKYLFKNNNKKNR